MEAARLLEIVRVRDRERLRGTDRAAVEEPLEVRLHGRPFAVIMRTPGADRELAAGFLLSEGVLKSAADLAAIEHCTDADSSTSPRENVLNVTLEGASREDLERVLADRRQVQGNTSCGMCGRLSIESIQTQLAPLPVDRHVSRDVIVSLAGVLRKRQTIFDETGGLHAAGLFTAHGVLDEMAEDVGRHNAVDKVIGRMVMKEALPLSDHLLFVSGRVSFEIVQKAVMAGVPVIAAVSAPSSLAVDLASDAGAALVAFVRGDSFNIYAHPERII